MGALNVINSLVGTADYSVSTWAVLPALSAGGRLHDSSIFSLHRMPYQHCQQMHAALSALHILRFTPAHTGDWAGPLQSRQMQSSCFYSFVCLQRQQVHAALHSAHNECCICWSQFLDQGDL